MPYPWPGPCGNVGPSAGLVPLYRTGRRAPGVPLPAPPAAGAGGEVAHRFGCRSGNPGPVEEPRVGGTDLEERVGSVGADLNRASRGRPPAFGRKARRRCDVVSVASTVFRVSGTSPPDTKDRHLVRSTKQRSVSRRFHPGQYPFEDGPWFVGRSMSAVSVRTGRAQRPPGRSERIRGEPARGRSLFRRRPRWST